MGYYDPPDVSEGNYRMTCKGYLPENTRAVPLAMISEIRTLLEDTETASSEKIDRYMLAMLEMPKAVDVECNYDGDVDAWFSGGKTAYTAHWTCPLCGTEGEEDREAGDDHPDL